MVILGNCYYLYSDEAGSPDLVDRNEFFCFGTMAIYRDPIESIVSSNIKVAKGKTSSWNNHRTIAQILGKNQIDVNIVSLDLTNFQVRQRIRDMYQKKINSSPIPEDEKPTIRNYTWMNLYLDSIIASINRIIKGKQKIGTVIPYYNEVKMKDREMKIIENVTGDTMLKRFNEAISRTEAITKRKVPDDMVIYPISAKPVDKMNLGIRIVDNVVSGFRRSVLEKRNKEFLDIFPMIQYSDITSNFPKQVVS